MSDYINIDGKLVNRDCKLLVGENKKRVGSKSWMRFMEYGESKSVGEYLDNGGLREDLRWDVKKGFVKLLEVYDYKMKKVVKVK